MVLHTFLPYNGWMVLFYGQMQWSLNKKYCKLINNENYFENKNVPASMLTKITEDRLAKEVK